MRLSGGKCAEDSARHVHAAVKARQADLTRRRLLPCQEELNAVRSRQHGNHCSLPVEAYRERP